MIHWKIANKNLMAKALSELSFEEILNPTEITAGEFELRLSNDVVYSFKAKKTIWNMFRVDIHSIKRNGALDFNAADFFIDAQTELEMDDIVLGNFIEEMNNSLFSDLVLLEKQTKTTMKDIVKNNFRNIQSYLNGHPKILISKGRVGWGIRELKSYAPEQEDKIQFLWIAVKKDLAISSIDKTWAKESLLSETMDVREIKKFKAKLLDLKINEDDFIYLPVHSWQWDRFVKIQFYKDLSSGDMVEIGFFGDFYLPQISIRSFSNISRVGKVDIKLPLSILNTSAIRGIASKYIDIGCELSSYLENLCKEDAVLKNTIVLNERAGVAFEHSDFSKIKDAPYRYKEYLGAIWRDSAESKTKVGETTLMTGALFFEDINGNSLIGEIIKASKLSISEWMTKYFQEVVIPLYHLQLEYGVGLVAHGQNIILKMTNYIPSGVIIKDFQGDLRLSENSILLVDKDFEFIGSKLEKLPDHYLIHDLLTGHFVTVLRFVSSVLENSNKFSEIEFYALLAKEIKNYLGEKKISSELNFLNPKITKVLVNKVRFKVGYGDSSQRPRPMVGQDIVSPIFLGLESLEASND